MNKLLKARQSLKESREIAASALRQLRLMDDREYCDSECAEICKFAVRQAHRLGRDSVALIRQLRVPQ